jgi:hypothetical protein
MGYCDEADVYAHGLQAGSVPSPARLVVQGADVAANTISLDSHGFRLDAEVMFRADQIGGASLPSPLVSGVTYYAIPVTSRAFRVAASPGGAAIDLTTAGARVLVVTPVPVDAAIEWASRLLDDVLPAHVVPIDVGNVPEVVRFTCAELAGWKLAARAGTTSVSLSAIYDAARKRLDRWASGVPVRGAPEAPRAGLSAISGGSRRDPLGWRKYGGL